VATVERATGLTGQLLGSSVEHQIYENGRSVLLGFALFDTP
jgi:hypothetical protein